MERKRIAVDLCRIPQELRSLFAGAEIYDSSCSPQARVWYIERDGGIFFKRAPGGTLAREAECTRYFHRVGLGAEVLAYLSLEEDYLVTRRVPGEDATHKSALARPSWLCDALAEALFLLHSLPTEGCPVPQRLTEYLSFARRNWEEGVCDPSFFREEGAHTKETLWQIASEGAPFLQASVFTHGDYCLPNVIFEKGRLSGFIDLGNAGVSDRHVDLFWGAWSLWYNLKTDAYRERFFDAYGRKYVDADALRTVAAIECFA